MTAYAIAHAQLLTCCVNINCRPNTLSYMQPYTTWNYVHHMTLYLHVSNELILLTFTTGVRDGQGHSLVDMTLTNMYDPVYLNIALYLTNHGVDDEQDKARLLCEACKWGNLDVVKELVEQHNVDPNGEYYDCAPSHCTV